MSANAVFLPCPICSQTGVFHSIQSLRDRLIYVSTNTLVCPVCQEEVLGLDKLTIHLFSHVQLLFIENIKNSEIISSKNIKYQVPVESKTKKSLINTPKNSVPSSVTKSTVKYVKICPKPPQPSSFNVPINSVPQRINVENERLSCDQISLQKPKTESLPASKQNETSGVCNICGLKFPDTNILEMHQKLIHDTNEDTSECNYKFRCHLCSKTFKMRGSLMVHLRVAHFGFLTCDRVKKLEKSERLECPTKEENKNGKITACEKFDNMSNKQWQCEVCRKHFTTKYFLKKHKRLHTGETPYACTQCNKTFTFQQSYHKHLLYHNDEKPHICNYCGRAFKELSTLHNHQRIHTGEKPFSCESCGKCFRQRVSYLVHRRIHTGVMPYKCTACEKSFRYKVSQRTHKCLAKPPGTVIRQPGELVEKLKKRQSTSEYKSYERTQTSQEFEDIPNISVQQHSELLEANAELIRCGAKLSLEDMESEYFKLIPESNEKTEDTTLVVPNTNDSFNLCHDLLNDNLNEFINCFNDNDKNIPSPSEILKNLCLSNDDEQIETNDCDRNKNLNKIYP